MEITAAFSPVNAFWSLLLFCIVVWKLWRLRQDIHELAASLRNLGDPFVRRDLEELKGEVQRLTARLVVTEEEAGISKPMEQG